MTKKTKENKKRGLTVLTPEDHFRFECHQSLDCFTRCCRDITIFLTPYDILCMKNALNITSGDFLTSHTDILVGDAGLAVVVLRMRDDEKKSCPFVTSGGCKIYEDRPWACRIYPLKPESTDITEKSGKNIILSWMSPFVSVLPRTSSCLSKGGRPGRVFPST